jgi:hypothetical protein
MTALMNKAMVQRAGVSIITLAVKVATVGPRIMDALALTDVATVLGADIAVIAVGIGSATVYRR